MAPHRALTSLAWILALMVMTIIETTRAARFDHRLVQRFTQELQRCSEYQSLALSLVSPEDQYQHVAEDVRKMQGAAMAGGREPTDVDSVFCLGGATQPFTSVLLSYLLYKNENFTMDTPLHRITESTYHLPGKFRTRRVNLKDILSMRTGLGNMDIVAEAKGMNRYSLMRNLRFAPELAPFREQDVYSEVLYSLAEDAAGVLSGGTWYKALHDKVLSPLGMDSAVFVHSDAQSKANVALPYLLFREKHHQIPWEAFKGQEVVGAATSLCASTRDMTKWLNFVLTRGRSTEDRQVMPQSVVDSTFQSVQYREEGDNPRKSGFRPPTVDNAYTRESNALGWIRGSYRGEAFVSADGSLPGYESMMTILPSGQGAVYAAFTGVGGSKAFALKTLINMYSLDLVLKGTSSINVCDTLRKMSEATREADARAKSSPPRPHYATNEDELPRPVEDYLGTYRNYAFGDVHVKHNSTETGRVQLELEYGEFGMFVLDQSTQNDTFIMRAKGALAYSTDYVDYRPSGPFLAIFGNRHDDPSLRIESVTIPHFSSDMDPTFSKNPAPPPSNDYCSDCPCSAASLPSASFPATATTAAMLVFVCLGFVRSRLL